MDYALELAPASGSHDATPAGLLEKKEHQPLRACKKWRRQVVRVHLQALFWLFLPPSRRRRVQASQPAFFMGDPPPPLVRTLGELEVPRGEDIITFSAAGQEHLEDSLSASSSSHMHVDDVSDVDTAFNSPPFWTRHDRTLSAVSYQSIVQTRPPPIQLEDHSGEHHEQSQGCWARSVTVDDYVVISGSSGIGAYIVWNCTVSTLKGGNMSIRKRYSEFDQLRENLIKSFPNFSASIPQLPRKSVVSRFRPRFLEHRKNGLNHFINCILLNPEFAASPVLKEFIFSAD